MFLSKLVEVLPHLDSVSCLVMTTHVLWFLLIKLGSMISTCVVFFSLPTRASSISQKGLKGAQADLVRACVHAACVGAKKSLDRCGVQRRVVAGASGIGTWVSNVFAVCGTAIAEDDHQLCHVRQALAWCHLSCPAQVSICKAEVNEYWRTYPCKGP